MYYPNNNNYSRRIYLMNTLRKLWEQHIMWTRSFIISAVDNLGDVNYVTNRLLQNPMDFANLLRQFYGNQTADRFQELLSQHLLIAADLVKAAKASNTQSVNEIRKKWYENADQIAAFLAKINPYWSENQWKILLYDHLRMVEDEAVTRLNGNFEQNVRLFDAMEDEALKMADEMFRGISAQFRI